MATSKAQRCTVGPTLMLGLCVAVSACSWIPKGETAMDVGVKDRGIASWYGLQFHGRLAANGEVFDMDALTAAHRTLPLGSVVRVVNLVNGKHVRVRITDRGPYVNGRILDLSYAAAARLGMVERGISVVQVEVVGDHRPEFLSRYDGGHPRTFILSTDAMEADTRRPILTVPAFVRRDGAQIKVQRQFPGDVVLQRRSRRLASVLASDSIARSPVAALLLS